MIICLALALLFIHSPATKATQTTTQSKDQLQIVLNYFNEDPEIMWPLIDALRSATGHPNASVYIYNKGPHTLTPPIQNNKTYTLFHLKTLDEKAILIYTTSSRTTTHSMATFSFPKPWYMILAELRKWYNECLDLIPVISPSRIGCFALDVLLTHSWVEKQRHYPPYTLSYITRFLHSYTWSVV